MNIYKVISIKKLWSFKVVVRREGEKKGETTIRKYSHDKAKVAIYQTLKDCKDTSNDG